MFQAHASQIVHLLLTFRSSNDNEVGNNIDRNQIRDVASYSLSHSQDSTRHPDK